MAYYEAHTGETERENIKFFIRSHFISREKVEEVIEKAYKNWYGHEEENSVGALEALSDLCQELLGKEIKE